MKAVKKSIKLSTWAKNHDLSYRGAYQMYAAGKITNAYRLESGAIMVIDETLEAVNDKTVIYARVSSPKQSNDLTRQIEFDKNFCVANGWPIDQVFKEIASGLNDNRPILKKLMLTPNIKRIIISDKDRLTRFGFNYLQTYFESRGCELVVINRAETNQTDLMQDFVSVITSMALKIYGNKYHRDQVRQIIENIKK